MTDTTAPLSKPHCNREDALAVLKRLREAGHIAYFAGGCVRDELLGIEPNDYDVATDAPPQRVRELFSNTQAVGAAFGVILVRQRRSTVEVATFRSDDVYLDGRRPSKVHFTTAEEDAKRRDFTINGLFLDPIENRVIDYVGGQEDLKNRYLRAIGEPSHRFEEDHLRLLRAVRFVARFDLQIEAATAAAMRQYDQSLVSVRPERIADYLRMMLCPPTRTSAWSILRHYHFIHLIFRFVPSRNEAGPGHGTSTIFERTAPGNSIGFPLALAAAAAAFLWPRIGGDDISGLFTRASVKRIAAGLRRSLRISNEELSAFEGTLGGVGLLLADWPPRLALLKRFLSFPTAGMTRQLLAALAAAGFYVDRIEWLGANLDQIECTEYAPPPLITGDDLTATGLQPGKLFKRILDEAYDAQLEERIKTKEQALDLAMKIANS